MQPLASQERKRLESWDTKRLLKLIVTSATYRQSSRVTPTLLQRDPDNRLLARGPRFRLSADVIRDQALAASGLLVEKRGGPSVKPYQPAGLAKELTGVDLSKASQSSDWAAASLSKDQLDYAASDVLHLHKVKTILDMMLARENRTALAEACFRFLPTRAELDLSGWAGDGEGERDIFAH